MKARIAAAAALAALTIFALHNNAAHAFEMLRKGVTISNVVQSGYVDYNGKRTQHNTTQEVTLRVRSGFAILRTELPNFTCRVRGLQTEYGILFSRRGTHSGSFNCETVRTGTPAQWAEEGFSGTFTSAQVATQFADLLSDFFGNFGGTTF